MGRHRRAQAEAHVGDAVVAEVGTLFDVVEGAPEILAPVTEQLRPGVGREDARHALTIPVALESAIPDRQHQRAPFSDQERRAALALLVLVRPALRLELGPEEDFQAAKEDDRVIRRLDVLGQDQSDRQPLASIRRIDRDPLEPGIAEVHRRVDRRVERCRIVGAHARQGREGVVGHRRGALEVLLDRLKRPLELLARLRPRCTGPGAGRSAAAAARDPARRAGRRSSWGRSTPRRARSAGCRSPSTSTPARCRPCRRRRRCRSWEALRPRAGRRRRGC